MILPKEVLRKLDGYTAKRRQEGSCQRSGIGQRKYYQMLNDNWYVFVTRSTGKIQTVQMPEGEPYGYGGRVRHVRRHR